MARRGGLGKGLGALIPPGGTEGAAETAGLDELPLASIRPNRFQPRDHFDEEALALLAESIREVGVLQPVLVRPTGEDTGEEYELIAGERRWRAARRVGLQTIPALVRETDDAAALEQALVENLHRDSLNPLEEAAAYQQLIEDFAKYLYLPRLKGPQVLVSAVTSGVGLLTWEHDAFAYAEGYDDAAGRYRFVIAPTGAGSTPFRLWLRASRLHPAAPSGTVTLTVRP